MRYSESEQIDICNAFYNTLENKKFDTDAVYPFDNLLSWVPYNWICDEAKCILKKIIQFYKANQGDGCFLKELVDSQCDSTAKLFIETGADTSLAETSWRWWEFEHTGTIDESYWKRELGIRDENKSILETARELMNQLEFDGNTTLATMTKSIIIHHLVEKGDIAALKKIELNADVIDLPNIDGETPLIVACRKGYLSIAEYLLENNAKDYVIDKNGRNAFYYAQQHPSGTRSLSTALIS